MVGRKNRSVSCWTNVEKQTGRQAGLRAFFMLFIARLFLWYRVAVQFAHTFYWEMSIYEKYAHHCSTLVPPAAAAATELPPPVTDIANCMNSRQPRTKFTPCTDEIFITDTCGQSGGMQNSPIGKRVRFFCGSLVLMGSAFFPRLKIYTFGIGLVLTVFLNQGIEDLN